MTKPTQKKDEDIIIDAEIIEEVAEKPKVVPTKPPISRSGPAFNIGNQFK